MELKHEKTTELFFEFFAKNVNERIPQKSERISIAKREIYCIIKSKKYLFRRYLYEIACFGQKFLSYD